MFKCYEHRGHVLLQCPGLFGSLNVHSTLRSMNREGFSRRSSTVGPGFITMFKAKDLTLCLSTRELIKENCAAKI